MIHNFPENILAIRPSELANPFRQTPDIVAYECARDLMCKIEGDTELSSQLSEGKMIGILVVEHPDSPQQMGYIAAFSGNVGGKSNIQGFVPPIFDLTDPQGNFKIKEAEITAINVEISKLIDAQEYSTIKQKLTGAKVDRATELNAMREKISESKIKRNSLRINCSDPTILERLTKESQFEKAELKRLKSAWDYRISEIEEELTKFEQTVDSLKKKRASMSEELQDWIFRQYIVCNHLSQEASIAEIFSQKGLIPPGGTGECAAPKLLNYAFRNNLKPLALGEFWYGKSPDTAVRTHGHFYPPCTSKCGPLLDFLLTGITFPEDNVFGEPQILFEDCDLVVISKPSGMPSVPGLDNRISLLEWLQNSDVTNHKHAEYHSVHRLDMDTSGVMIFAKSEEAALGLRIQFQEHKIKKTYHALLKADRQGKDLTPGQSGHINLPLSPDYDERPRQKVDMKQGKEAHTEYKVIDVLPEGLIDIKFTPITGRTHQLRVHSAHTSGLGHPILEDMLYGGTSSYTPYRLCLHAYSIEFIHPRTGALLTFATDINKY